MSSKALTDTVLNALEDMKARDVSVLDVRDMTTITDEMIIASGTSDRHVRSLAESVIEKCKADGFRPAGVEGLEHGEWVLVDLEDVLVDGVEAREQPQPGVPAGEVVEGHLEPGDLALEILELPGERLVLGAEALGAEMGGPVTDHRHEQPGETHGERPEPSERVPHDLRRDAVLLRGGRMALQQKQGPPISGHAPRGSRRPTQKHHGGGRMDGTYVEERPSCLWIWD